MLLPQTHSPEVDYSLFIMETVQMSMEKKETSPAGLRRSFPPPICNLPVSVSCFFRVANLSSKTLGGPFIQEFLGHEDASGRRIDANEATREEIGGPTRPGTVAAWGPLFWPSVLRSFTSFAPRSSSFQNNHPRKFIAHYDVVMVLKQIKKEIGVFCPRKINSIKRGKHY